ncbi:RNA polymerase Rpc34 [Calycina marina]|uniref:DNA-directed RNA polymerase III subunit RPC6 n=1 Tax=Calycina marina TaxID=1763456 RepID=A0A9P7ZAQ7_9HELO|nr:RNA polymerase Rpc34 [Calycina marina]
MAAPNVKALMEVIYEAFEEKKDSKETVSQGNILAAKLIPNDDASTLLAVAQGLCNEKKWKIVTDNTGAIAWRVRSQEEATKYNSLKPEDEIVYSFIDESGRDGIWIKTIRSRSQLHDSLVNAAIKHLVSKKYIQEMKSVEASTRKMYIRSGLVQSDKTKGGPWFTDGDLDEVFIDGVRQALYDYILNTSLYLTAAAQKQIDRIEKRAKEPKKKSKISTHQVQALRDRGLGTTALTMEEEMQRRMKEQQDELAKAEYKYDGYITMPAGYTEYKTLDELTEFVLGAGLAQGLVLTAKDLKQLLDVMCFDGDIEIMKIKNDLEGYKATRQSVRPHTKGPYNRLTEAPCGRCPVFDLCEEGGPVGPSNCKYFQDWLEL